MQSYLLLHHVQCLFPQGRQLYLLNKMPLFALHQQQATGAVNGDKGKESGDWEWRDW